MRCVCVFVFFTWLFMVYAKRERHMGACRWPLPSTLPCPHSVCVLCAMYKQAIEFLVHFVERTSTCEDILYMEQQTSATPVNPSSRRASVEETSVEIRRKGQFYRQLLTCFALTCSEKVAQWEMCPVFRVICMQYMLYYI